MNCDDAIELLPWLLNGTLEPGEEREVRAHLAACERCRTALAETRLGGRIFGEHVATEDLVAHAFGDRPGTDPELIERHVAACPSCAAELEMVRSSRLLGENEEVATLPLRSAAPAATPSAAPRRFRAWRASAVAAGLVGVVAATGWIDSSGRLRSVEEQLAAERARARPPVAAAPVPGPADGRVAALEEEKRRLAARLEAEAAAAAGRERELKAELEAARKQQAAESAPSAAAPMIAVATRFQELLPVDRRQRGGEPAARAEEAVVERGAFVSLALYSASDAAGPRSFQVTGPSGRVITQGALLARAGDFYSLSLDTRKLPAGRYEIRVTGAGAPAEVFPFTLE